MTDRTLLQKTFHAETEDEIDGLVNEFGKNNNIKFTHSHVGYDENGKVQGYDYVVFYLPEEGNKEPSEETKECPKCNAEMPKSYEYHMKCGWKK